MLCEWWRPFVPWLFYTTCSVTGDKHTFPCSFKHKIFCHSWEPHVLILLNTICFIVPETYYTVQRLFKKFSDCAHNLPLKQCAGRLMIGYYLQANWIFLANRRTNKTGIKSWYYIITFLRQKRSTLPFFFPVTLVGLCLRLLYQRQNYAVQ